MALSVQLPLLSTVFLPNALGGDSGHFTGAMSKISGSADLAAVLGRIDERLTQLKLSDSRASKLAGKPEAIRNMRRGLLAGRAGVSTQTVIALANALECTPGWLLGDTENVNHVNEKPPQLVNMPLRGIVEAGAWRETHPQDAGEDNMVAAARDLRFPTASQYLLKVSGDSMNASEPIPIKEGALLRCVDWAETGLPLRTGQLVVVERRSDGGQLVETTVKRVHVFPDRYELRPESSNPTHKPLTVPIGDGQDGIETLVVALVTAVTYENLGY